MGKDVYNYNTRKFRPQHRLNLSSNIPAFQHLSLVMGYNIGVRTLGSMGAAVPTEAPGWTWGGAKITKIA
jgi:hypothetical protein